MSKETDSSDVKSPTWQDTEIEVYMPTLSPQEEVAESSVESSRPQLCASSGEWCLEGKVKTKQSNHEKELCVISHEEPKAIVPSSGDAIVKPFGNTECGCTVSDMKHILRNNTVVIENKESH